MQHCLVFLRVKYIYTLDHCGEFKSLSGISSLVNVPGCSSGFTRGSTVTSTVRCTSRTRGKYFAEFLWHFSVVSLRTELVLFLGLY